MYLTGIVTFNAVYDGFKKKKRKSQRTPTPTQAAHRVPKKMGPPTPQGPPPKKKKKHWIHV